MLTTPFLEVIGAVEPRIADAIRQELADQRASLKLIASENYASPAVLLAMGNWLSDKYAEGTIGHRFYAGCQNVDTVEQTAADHAQALFGAPHAYVQPHSGIDANLVAFWAILAQRVETPGAGRGRRQARQRPVRRGLGEAAPGARRPADARHVARRRRSPDPRLPAEHLRQDVRPALLRHRPRDRAARLRRGRARARGSSGRWSSIAGYSAYPRKVNFATMREIADEVGATLMVDMAHFAGLVAGKVFTGDFDPVPHAHVTTTTTHKSLRGPRGGMVLCQPEFADAVDRGCPMVLGGPLGHVMAAKAVALAEARQPAFADLRAARSSTTRVALADGPAAARRPARHRRHRQPPRAASTCSAFGLTGRQAESALLDAGIVTNRNSIPPRPERRLVHLRRPHRHPGADHARLRRRRVRQGRRADRRRAVSARPATAAAGGAVEGEVRHRRRGRRQGEGRGRRAARRQPALPGPRV